MRQPKQLSSQEYRELLAAHSQSEIVKERAQYVLVVDEEGNEIERFANHEYQIGVLAVLGPVSFGEVVHDQALWFEVGIGPSGPYRKPYGRGKKKIVGHTRKRFGRPGRMQLKQCLSSVEEILVGYTHMVRSGWKDDVSHIPAGGNGRKGYRKGVRFHVSLQDMDLVSVIVHSEIARKQRSITPSNSSKVEADTGFQVEIVARKMSGLLRVYGDRYFSHEWFQRKLRTASKRQWQLRHVLEWLEARRFLPHQLYLILKAMRGRPGEELFRAVLNYLEVDAEEIQRFGLLVEKNHTPIFSENVFVYCPPRSTRSSLGPYCNGRRKRDDSGKVVYDRFTFEIIPREETKRDPFSLGGRTVFQVGEQPPF